MASLSRRAFLRVAAAAPMVGTQVLRRPDLTPHTSGPQRVNRSVRWSMLPDGASWKERFQMAAVAGFDAVDVPAVESPVEADEIARAAADARLTIQTVVCLATTQFPLSSADPEIVKKGLAALKTALTVASMWHAEEVIVTPAVVNESAPPSAAWTRSQEALAQVLPLAGGFKLHIALAVPTDKFLLSLADCNNYIDTLRSPWVRASLAVGDTLAIGTMGTPQEWIRGLGSRITRLRLNDRHVDRKAGTSERRNIGDGDVNWQDVRKAMREVPYLNWVTADLDQGDRAYLANVRVRVDKFLAGFKPGGGSS